LFQNANIELFEPLAFQDTMTLYDINSVFSIDINRLILRKAKSLIYTVYLEGEGRMQNSYLCILKALSNTDVLQGRAVMTLPPR